MIKVNLKNLPQIIDTSIDLYKNRLLIFKHFLTVGTILHHRPCDIIKAYVKAQKTFGIYKKTMIKNNLTPLDILGNKVHSKNINENKKNILLLGHPYILYDSYISLDLVNKFRKSGINVITHEMIPQNYILWGAKKFPKDMFWTIDKEILGSAYYLLTEDNLDGVVHVASFGCGPDSMTGELLGRMIKKHYNTPYLYLNIDEQSGDAGFNTRIEAFLDILEGGGKNKDYLSTYG